MTDALADTTVVFLHGVNSRPTVHGIRNALAPSLTAVGRPDLTHVTVLAPVYQHALTSNPDDDRHTLAPITWPRQDESQRRAHLRQVGFTTSRLEDLLGPTVTSVSPSPGLNGVASLSSQFLDQAKAYAQKKWVRARVVNRILRLMPTSGRVVLIGHSLGSVVALDVIARLAPGIEVSLVTLGSPLPGKLFHDRLEHWDTPPPNVRSWVNIHGSLDPVTYLRGVSHAAPWSLNLRIRLAAHTSGAYLSDPVVAEVVADAVFGSRERAIVPVPGGMSGAAGADELLTVLTAGYGHRVLAELHADGTSERQVALTARFGAALSMSQYEEATRLRSALASAGRLPGATTVDFLAANTELHEVAPAPLSPTHLSAEQALPLLIRVAMSNPLGAYEVRVDPRRTHTAMARLSASMGLGSLVGRQCVKSLEFSRNQLKQSSSGPWKWVLLGVGGVALVAATGGLALSAAPGVAGAAAVTSALATFGPGGMVGGLATAGGLVGSGAAAVTGAALLNANQGTVEATLEGLVALAHARRDLHLEAQPDVWDQLSLMNDGVEHELRRHTTFSDEDSAVVKDLRRKAAAITLALQVVREQHLLPADPIPIG